MSFLRWIIPVLLMIDAAGSEAVATPRLVVWRGNETQTFLSQEYAVAEFDRAVLSWNCSNPNGEAKAAFELEVGGVRYLMGNWSDHPESRKTGTVAVDTLELKKPAKTFRFHVTPGSGTAVTLVAVTHWMNSDLGNYSEKRSAAWGKVLSVPQRSQNIEAKDAGAICSPTSLAMVLEFHGITKSTRDVAEGVFDHAEKIYGNWPFNTAFAHRMGGLEAYVVSATGFEELEAEIAAGRPAVTSHRWNRGELANSSVEATDGHLMTVAGFSDNGDVVVNDPAGNPGAVRRIYKRREFFKTWMENANGIMYVVKEKRGK